VNASVIWRKHGIGSAPSQWAAIFGLSRAAIDSDIDILVEMDACAVRRIFAYAGPV
jgi:hypothetical protein